MYSTCIIYVLVLHHHLVYVYCSSCQISELRRQLAAKSTFKKNAKMFTKHKTSSMEDTSSSHCYRAARKPSLDQKKLRDCNQSSVDSTLTLTQLNMQDNSQGM